LLLLNLPNNLEPAASKKTRRRRAEIDKQRRDDDRGSRDVGCGMWGGEPTRSRWLGL